MVATGSFHLQRRHAPIGRDVLIDGIVSPWTRLPRPGIHGRGTQPAALIHLMDPARRSDLAGTARQS